MNEEYCEPLAFRLAKGFLEALEEAKRYGLEQEFVAFVFRDLDIGEDSLENAIRYSNREWDL